MRKFEVELGGDVVEVEALSHSHAAEKAMRVHVMPVGDVMTVNRLNYSRIPGQPATREYRGHGDVIVTEILEQECHTCGETAQSVAHEANRMGIEDPICCE